MNNVKDWHNDVLNSGTVTEIIDLCQQRIKPVLTLFSTFVTDMGQFAKIKREYNSDVFAVIQKFNTDHVDVADAISTFKSLPKHQVWLSE